MAAKQKSGVRKVGGDSSGSGGDGQEFRSSTVVRTGLIRGNTFGVKGVQYVEIDGLAMFEGDIILGTAEEMAAASETLRAEAAGGFAAAVLITGNQFRWPNCRVPYTIDPALPNQARVTDAIAHWEANTNFRFIVRTTEPDWVTFRPGGGCSSMVGRRGGQQFVNLAAGCTLGSTIHEIGHVIGLWHEQSREDRDLFVTINWANITPGMEHNFNQHIADGDDVGAYDFASIMHYPRTAFSSNGLDTITPIAAVPPGVVLGQRNGLSAGDIAAANSLCPAPVKIGPKDPIKELRKEAIKDFRETTKELIKDIRLDTRKELILDTVKEQIRDTIKEAAFDPGPTIRENITTPVLPPVLPRVTGPLTAGRQPFAVATPHQQAPAGDLESSIAQLDATLEQLAEQLLQAEGVRQTLQTQFDETSALLKQLLQEHDQGPR